MTNVEQVGDYLSRFANWFEEEPWTLDKIGSDNRVTGLTTEWSKEKNKLRSRIKESFKWLTSFKKSSVDRLFYDLEDKSRPYWIYKIKSNIRMAKQGLKKDPYWPDYSLRDGTVVAVWAETGDYIISMQPAVGDKVAKFLMEDPTNPHAIAIAEEIQKGWDIAFPNQKEKTVFKGDTDD